MDLQPDELAALIRYHAARLNVNGHLTPDAAKRITELSEAIRTWGLTQEQVDRAKALRRIDDAGD